MVDIIHANIDNNTVSINLNDNSNNDNNDISYGTLRPVHLLRVFLLRVLESNFPGDPL